MLQSYVSFRVKIRSTYNHRTVNVSSSVVLKIFLFSGRLLLLSQVTSTLIASRSEPISSISDLKSQLSLFLAQIIASRY